MVRMYRVGVALLLPLGIAAAASAARGQGAPPRGGRALAVDYARYWRTPGNTLLEGLVHVDFAALGTGSAPAHIDFAVRDDQARTLYSESWDVAVPPVAASGVSGEVSTPFTVALAPGKYTVAVRLTHGSAVDSVAVPVDAFPASPTLSDLVTSPAIRVARDSEALAGSEMRRGRYIVERAPRVVLYPANPGLSYYIELYVAAAAAPEPDQVSFDVRSQDGTHTLLHTTQAAQVMGAGLPLVGRLNLAGLPAGDYRLFVGVKRGTEVQERSAGFTMLPLGSVEPRVAAAPPPPRATAASDAETKERYFSAEVMPDSTVKMLLDALVMAPPGPPLPKVVRTLTGEPLRNSVAQYFARLSPSAGTGRNKLYEEYTDRLREVNRLYSEKQTKRSGVHTDRGRIYMKYGAPDEKTEMEMQNRRNLELWKYSQQRGLRFVFLDETGFGHLNLIMSTDPNEPSVPDWQERIGDDTVVRQILQ